MKFLFFLLMISIATFTKAQQDTSLPAFKRYPVLPGLQLLTLDSTTFSKENISKKKQVLLMLFSPDCDHCQHEAEQIVANKEALKNTQIVMASTFPLYRLKEFAEKYGLNQMDNVAVTKDPYYLLVSFYAIRNFPFLALYNKNGGLIETFDGSVGIDKIVQSFKKAQ